MVNEGTTTRGLNTRIATQEKTLHRYRTVHELSKQRYPMVWQELAALATAADMPLDSLVLLNLLGDLGTSDGTGCTDVAVTTDAGTVLAHNEDGAPDFLAQCPLLTLLIDGEPAVTTWWYPGFVPSNSFVVTETGLVWGIDHINITTPAPLPGRHFVARAAQRCSTVPEFAGFLREHPTAGGYAYTVGRLGEPGALQIETAAGSYAHTTSDDEPLLWRTNHLRLPSAVIDAPTPNSLTRAKTADRWQQPGHDPVDWCLHNLARRGLPHGVRNDNTYGHDSAAVNLATGTLTLVPRDRQPITIPAEDFVRGIPDRATLDDPAPERLR